MKISSANSGYAFLLAAALFFGTRMHLHERFVCYDVVLYTASFMVTCEEVGHHLLDDELVEENHEPSGLVLQKARIEKASFEVY